MHELAFVIAGFVVGTIVGLTGVGGGSLMTPILIFVFGINNRRSERIQLGLLGVYLTGKTVHDAADPAVNLVVQLAKQGLHAGDIRVFERIIICQSDEFLLGFVQFAQ